MSSAVSRFILFGASMTEWSFDEETEGFGWFLEKAYRDKVAVVNEGDSLTEWAFDEHNEGFGWDLEQKYGDKVQVQCEGTEQLAANARTTLCTEDPDSQELIEKHSYTSTRLLHDFDRIIAQATAPNAPRTLLFTIFLGANDACFIGETEFVPLPIFEANIRKFIETILVQDAMAETKIVLITPPPINIPSPDAKDKDENEMRDANQAKREMRGYKTYMNKRRYAERIMQIAREYEETGRVIGLDFWGDLVRARLEDFEEDYDEDKLPGSGLYGGRDFSEGYFTDGLHLDKKGYNVLSRGLYDAVLSKWPERSPDQL
ncbi:hypothetical protein E8E11_007463 [Didymella keratinophila]|nr:hypothetical protein E8E11_007463 [Didymella keratinophila]